MSLAPRPSHSNPAGLQQVGSVVYAGNQIYGEPQEEGTRPGKSLREIEALGHRRPVLVDAFQMTGRPRTWTQRGKGPEQSSRNISGLSGVLRAAGCLSAGLLEAQNWENWASEHVTQFEVLPCWAPGPPGVSRRLHLPKAPKVRKPSRPLPSFFPNSQCRDTQKDIEGFV